MFPWRPQLTHLWITCTCFLITVDRWSRGESEWSAMPVDLKCERPALVAYTPRTLPRCASLQGQLLALGGENSDETKKLPFMYTYSICSSQRIEGIQFMQSPKRTFLWVHMYYTLNNPSTTPPWQNGRHSKGTHPPCYEISNCQLTWAMSRIGTTTHTSPAIWLDRGKTKSHACERNLLQRNFKTCLLEVA